MTMTLGDMTHSFALRRQSAALKAEQTALSTAMTTGQVADTAKHLGGDFSALAAVDASTARLSAYKNAGALVAGLAEGMQTALGRLDTLTSGLGLALSEPAMAGNAPGLAAAAADAHGRFHSAVAALNADHAGQSLFGGAGTGAALADGETILRAIEAQVQGIRDPAALEAAVTAWFEDPAGFAATAYTGTDARAPMAIAAQDSVALDVTARDPAIRDSLKALSLGALLDRGTFAGDPTARAALAQSAQTALLTSADARTQLQGRIGAVESRIDILRTQNEAEASALGIARSTMTAADPYETAVRFEAVSTQIETLHAVTARLSKLSLVDFL